MSDASLYLVESDQRDATMEEERDDCRFVEGLYSLSKLSIAIHECMDSLDPEKALFFDFLSIYWSTITMQMCLQSSRTR
jgi:hypothetical protein